jgi:hypothetical protein
MIREFIKNHIIPNTFNDYKLNNGIWTLQDWQSTDNNPFYIGNSLVFIYYFQMIGIVDDITDFANGLAIIENEKFVSKRVDYKNLVKYTPLDGAYIASSDFISVHQKTIKITLPTTNVFSSKISGHIAYYELTPHKK